MPKIQQHTHKLKRHKYKTTGHSVFFCVLDCGFKVDTGLSLGRKTICWICGKETTINEYSIRLARPRCNSCIKKKDEPVISETEILQEAAVETGHSLGDRLRHLTGTAKDEEL